MAGPRLRHYDRKTFVDRVFNYNEGEHGTIIGFTGSGKTTLGYQLMNKIAKPALPVISILSKPKDETTLKAAQKARYRTVRQWPPTWSPTAEKNPRGYVIWPDHTFDPNLDDAAHLDTIQRVIRDSYKRGNRVIYTPDLYGLLLRAKPLERDYQTGWVNGRAMGLGIWVDTQKPTHIPLLAYNQATHLFLFREPDKRGRERFNEIGGFDGKLVEQANMTLERHQALYVCQRDQTMCVVEA
jgi:energy-coupling factor transporter ATP-binding protein EcfA2